MKTVKKNIKNFFLVSVPTFLILFLILEFVVFRLWLPASDSPIWFWDEDHQIIRFFTKERTEGRHTIGRYGKNLTHWKINQQGWISDVDYETQKEKPRICVIGDSFVQAMQVNTGEAFPQLLRKLFQDSVDVYSMGTNGSPLSNYYFLAKYAVAEFQPDVLIFNCIINDFEESVYRFSSHRDFFWTFEYVNEDSVVARKPVDRPVYTPIDQLSFHKKLLRALYRSAISRYLRYNAQFHLTHRLKEQKAFEEVMRKDRVEQESYRPNANGNSFARFTSFQGENEEPSPKQILERVIQHILSEMKDSFPNTRIIFMMDAPRWNIYHHTLDQNPDQWKVELLREKVQTFGFEFLDLMPAFQADYERHQREFEFLPYDFHWNAYGHQLVARTLQEYLFTNPQQLFQTAPVNEN